MLICRLVSHTKECHLCENPSDHYVDHPVDAGSPHSMGCKPCVVEWVSRGNSTCPICIKEIDIHSILSPSEKEELLAAQNRHLREEIEELAGDVGSTQYSCTISCTKLVGITTLIMSVALVQFFRDFL